MQVIGTPSVLAPQSTGHPASLPATPQKPALVKPATNGTNADGPTDRPRDWAGQFNSGYKPPPERAAPPSALQIEIETILAEQAETQEKLILEGTEDIAEQP